MFYSLELREILSLMQFDVYCSVEANKVVIKMDINVLLPGK